MCRRVSLKWAVCGGPYSYNTLEAEILELRLKINRRKNKL